MYAIRTRNGNVYMKIKRNFGDMSALNVGLGFAVQWFQMKDRYRDFLIMLLGTIPIRRTTSPTVLRR